MIPVHLAASLAFVAFLLFAFLGAIVPGHPITLRVSPHVALAPATITIQVRAVPIESDREILVLVNGEDFYRSSRWPIMPDGGSQTYQPVQYRDLPHGTYQVIASIGPIDQTRAWAGTEVHVR